MIFGTDEQKKQHLTGITSGDIWWCTSEPGAGSDLASMQTRALEDGDDYVINGQKIWTSGGHKADWGWLAVQTNADAPKHTGISLFLLDVKTPGVSVQPLINMANDHSFNQVFFEDVSIPKQNLVGEKDRGWYHFAVALNFERSGIRWFAGGRRTLDEMLEVARSESRYTQANLSFRYELADRA